MNKMFLCSINNLVGPREVCRAVTRQVLYIRRLVESSRPDQKAELLMFGYGLQKVFIREESRKRLLREVPGRDIETQERRLPKEHQQK